jgi:hypothetical protein
MEKVTLFHLWLDRANPKVEEVTFVNSGYNFVGEDRGNSKWSRYTIPLGRGEEPWPLTVEICYKDREDELDIDGLGTWPEAFYTSRSRAELVAAIYHQGYQKGSEDTRKAVLRNLLKNR